MLCCGDNFTDKFFVLDKVTVGKNCIWCCCDDSVNHKHASFSECCHRYLPYDLLTPRNRVLLEKLTRSQLVKKFPTFYGTRKFITEFTSACHLSLS